MKIKILFFGSDQFSITTFKTIYQNLSADFDFNVACIPNGFFEKYILNNQINKIPYTNNAKLNFDIGIVASFGKFISPKIISQSSLGCMLNVHPSCLPEWRGPAPLQRSIMNDTNIGVSVIDIHPKIMDFGDIYLQQRIVNNRQSFFTNLCKDLAILGGNMVSKIISENLLQSKFEQNHSKATYAAAITSKDAKISCVKMTFEQIYNIYRAISHQETLYIDTIDNKTIYLRKISSGNSNISLEPGKIFYDKFSKCLYIGCIDNKNIGVFEGSLKGKSTILNAGGLYSALHLKQNQLYFN